MEVSTQEIDENEENELHPEETIKTNNLSLFPQVSYLL